MTTSAKKHESSDKARPQRPLPGDRTKEETIKRMIRVDHAGEFGAVHIYRGQLAVLGDTHPKAGLIRHMAEQEEDHLATFSTMIAGRKVRPTALAPFWEKAGFALGAATAFLGPKAAMACTQAVEEVIDEHYAEQRALLDGEYYSDETELAGVIEKFQAEEVEHKNLAIEHGAEEAVGHSLMTAGIKTGCRAAIWLAKRI